VQPPLKINILQFCTATAPPPAGTPQRVTGASGAGGAGTGVGGAGTGAGGAGAGGSGSAGKVNAGITDHSPEGFLTTYTTYRSHSSKTLISATTPQSPPSEIIIYFHCPVTAPTKNQ